MAKHWTAASLLVSLCATLVAGHDTSVFSKISNDSLLWGPYRPNLYFGVRSRVPKSLSTGLLWARVEDFVSVQQNTRYTCEQNEGMAGYGWDAYDPRTGGVQTIHDRGNGIDLETSFVKFDEGRGGWAAMIKGTPRDGVEPLENGPFGKGEGIKTAVWFTIATEGISSVLPKDFEDAEELGFEGDIVFEGKSSDSGDFKLTIAEPRGDASHPVHSHASYQDKPLDRTFVHSHQVPAETLWQCKAILFNSIKTTVEEYIGKYTKEQMPPPWQTYTIQNKPGGGNMHLVQKVFQGPFEFSIFYTPAGATEQTSASLAKAIGTVTRQFDEKYLQVYKPLAPFSDKTFVVFGKSLLSNLMGGIGYFYGDQFIDRSYAEEYDEDNDGFWQDAEEARGRGQQKLEGPYELFTSIPSRPFFPRGFLWDEGFHLLPILDWDAELVMQILSSWFNTMDEDGWIPREQILGEEARSKVPQEFQVQYPHYANPPTLFIALEALVDKIEGAAYSGAALNLGDVNGNALATAESVKAWLRQLYPYLQRNFDWYRRTQWGDLKSYDREAFNSKEGYRWRGRTPRHILTSGLDDYPRAQPPHPGELHVDLMSWMGLMSRNIHRIAKFLEEAEDEAKYRKIEEAIRRNVDDLHWSKEHKTYCDSTIDEYEESIHVCHKGYISIFPFMCGLLGPDHKHLKDVLDLIADEEELWSPFGIRSLSRKDEFYGTDENYWRSPVWMNMNYLIISQLYALAKHSGPQQNRAATMYDGLRKNLVDTVYKSWLDTGFAWEQYNPETGEGQRTQHFTGWTSLVAKIMAMPELGRKKTAHEEL